MITATEIIKHTPITIVIIRFSPSGTPTIEKQIIPHVN